MAISIPAAFTKLGTLAGLLKAMYAFQNGTWLTDVNAVIAQFPVGYQSINDYISQVNQPSGLTGQLVTNPSANLSIVQQTAQAVIQQIVQADVPPSFNVDTGAAIGEFLRQMRQQGYTIKRCTVAATSGAASGVTNTGNGQVVLSTKRADGLIQENLFAESTLLACTSDAQTGGQATAGNEGFAWLGTQAAGDFLDPNWPQGSGSSASWNTISALYDNSNGNVLVNGDFEDWTVANTPDNWSILTGTAGVNIFKSTSQYFTGTTSLRIKGDGTTLVSIAQQFNVSTGTTYAIPPQTQYAIGFWIFLDAIPAQGILEIALVDNAGAITTDSYGTQNVCTVDLPAVAAGEPVSLSQIPISPPSSNPYPVGAWVPISCVFRSGTVLPTQFWVRYRLTTALTNLVDLFIDQTAMGIMTPLYTGGPSIVTFDGSTHFISGGGFPLQQGPPDQFLLTTTNDRGGAASLASWQPMLLRLLTTSDTLWPSADSPSIADSTIVG